MSANWRGFVMDESVRDEAPNMEFPSPQFSINGDWKKAFRSMNSPPDGQSDTRPNLWSVPTGNWAQLHLIGFKV